MTYGDGAGLGRFAARRLATYGADIDTGLTDREIDRAEREFGFTFADDHRAFLETGLPRGDKWPDWRHPSESLAEQLRWPIDGLLFDVAHDTFWYPQWGGRPGDVDEAVLQADSLLAMAPRMVPVYAHRYLPEGLGTYGHPVLSMWQSDIIRYGANLVDYVEHEVAQRKLAEYGVVTVDFWRDLVD